jgi:hypothetical protein
MFDIRKRITYDREKKMFKSHKNVIKVVIFAVLLLASFGLANADEVTDSINEGLQQYKKGEYAAAAGNLDYASQLIRQKRGEQLKTFLPKPLAGWKAKESTSQAVGAAMFGGGVSAERKYHKESSSVTVKIVTDSPLMQSMMVMFTNPMFAASSGGKLEKVNGQKAIVKYSSTNKSGEINIVVVNRFLITIEGNDVTKKELKNYAGSINYKKLAAFL